MSPMYYRMLLSNTKSFVRRHLIYFVPMNKDRSPEMATFLYSKKKTLLPAAGTIENSKF